MNIHFLLNHLKSGFGASAASNVIRRQSKRLACLGFLSLLSASAFGAAPANDNFANAIVLTGNNPIAPTVVLDSATAEAGEPTTDKKTVWYKWTASDNLNVALGTNGYTGNSSIYVNVWIGDTIQSLTMIASDRSSTSFTAVKGVSYVFEVALFYSYDTATVPLSMTSTPYGSGANVITGPIDAVGGPTNNTFANTFDLGSVPVTLVTYIGNGTRETAEPSGNGYKTVWYKYTAPETQWLTWSTEGNIKASTTTVFQGSDFSNLQFYANTVGSSKSGKVLIQSGKTYYISIGNYYSGDTFNTVRTAFLTQKYSTSSPTVYGPTSPDSAAPYNDNFNRTMALQGALVTAFGYTNQATRESFEPGTIPNTIWYSWGTDATGTATLTVDRSATYPSFSFNVYTGSTLLDLAKVTVTRTSTSPYTYTFPVTAKTTYYIQLGDGDGGLLHELDIKGPGAGTFTVSNSHFINVSNRSVVANNDNMIPGFVVRGDQPKKVLIRAVGPTLGEFGVKGFMTDPVLEVYSGQTVIASNDDWSGNGADVTALNAAFDAGGAFHLLTGSKDAALVITLSPGAYTVQVHGSDATSRKGGDVIAEVYDIE